MSTIRLAGIVKQSITDGPGLRLTLFTQGCPHHCNGCHNPETWSYAGGKDYTSEEIIVMLKANPLLRGITFSGGEPLDKAKELIVIAKEAAAMGKDIVCYTGYIYEDIVNENNPYVMELLGYIWMLVDGPFIMAQKDISKAFVGSSNQRIIDIQESLAKGETVILEV